MKVILGVAGGYLVLLWALCIAVYLDRSRSVSYDWNGVAPLAIFAAALTVAAATLLRKAWRRDEDWGAAVFTSLVAAAVMFVLLLRLVLEQSG